MPVMSPDEQSEESAAWQNLEEILSSLGRININFRVVKEPKDL